MQGSSSHRDSNNSDRRGSGKAPIIRNVIKKIRTCPHCPQRFERSSDFQKHLRDMHRDSSRSTSETHHRASDSERGNGHGSSSRTSREVGQSSSAGPSNSQASQSSSTHTPLLPPAFTGFECRHLISERQICGIRFSREHDLRLHRYFIHISPYPYKCDRCEKRFARKSLLDIHVISVHEDHKYRCDECGEWDRRPKDLPKHMREKHYYLNIHWER